MQTYLQQTTQLAAARGVDFKRAVLAAGLSDAQYYRWINKATLMSERSARKVETAIERLSKRAAAAAAQVQRALEEPADADAQAG